MPKLNSKNKKQKSKTQKVQKKSSRISPVYIKIFVIAAIVLFVIIVAKSFTAHESYKVLGASTLLASSGSGSGGDDSDDHSGGSGDDSNSGSGSIDDNSGSQEQEVEREDTSGSGGSDEKTETTSSLPTTLEDNTRGTCTGPDGRQFETRYKDCVELNKAWNKSVIFKALPQRVRVKTESNKSEVRVREGGTRIKIEEHNGEQKTEVRLSDQERIRTRTKDGLTRVDITSHGVKTRFEYKDGQLVVKAEQEDGTEVELEDESLDDIEDRLAQEDIKVASIGAKKFMIQKGVVGAVTHFPISVDLATNTLFINTPSGQKAVTVLPEQAVQNMMKTHVFDKVIDADVEDPEASSAGQLVTLDETNDVLTYEMEGVDEQRFLGVLPVQLKKHVLVSAETGNAVSIQQSFLSRLLDAVSF